MKKLIITLLLLTILIEGFIFFFSRSVVEEITKWQFRKETGLNLDFQDWQRQGYSVTVYNPKITADSSLNAGSITAESLKLDCNPTNILSRKLLINEILIIGLSIDSPSKQSAFFKLIDTIIKDNPDPLLKTSLITIKGENFKTSKFGLGDATVVLQPSNIEFNFTDQKRPQVKAESPLEISLALPSLLTNISRIVGQVSISGALLSPEITSNFQFKNSDLIHLSASFTNGLLTLRPVIQANIQSGQTATAKGELQLKGLRLTANDFTISALPLSFINPALVSAQSEITLKGDLDLATLNGDFIGAINIRDIETLPVNLKNLSLELAITNKDLKITKGRLQGEAGAIDLTGGYNLETKTLSGQLKSEQLLIKTPDIKLKIPRGIHLTTAIYFLGSLSEPRIKGNLGLEFFKLGFNGEKTVEARIPSDIELVINRNEPLKSLGQWRIAPLAIDAQGREIKTQTSVVIDISNGRLTLPQMELFVGDRKVKIGGNLSEQGYDFTALGSAELVSLVGRRDNIEDIDGEIAVKLDLQGPLKAPQINGEVSLTGGAFSIPLSGDRFHLEEISGKASFDDRKISLSNFHNTAGDARFELTGEIDEFLTGQRRGRVNVKFEQVTLQPDPNLIIHLHADSELTLNPDSLPKLNTKIYLEDALYEQRSNLQELVKKLLGLLVKGSETATSRSLTSPILADLQISAERNLVVDTDIFQGELSADLSVIASPESIKINGSFFGDSGELKLSRNKFDVSLIKLVFQNQELGSLPIFELKADGELGPRGSAEQVQLAVEGVLPSPTIRLSSESARSQKELLAELGLGVDKLSVFSNQSKASPSLISALNPFTGAGLKDRVGDLTGGAIVLVESGYSADTGTFAPRLLLEQSLPFSFRLVAQSELSQFNRSEINLEYPLTDQTNIFTGWKNAPTTRNPENLSGSFGVGVHYRERFPGTLVLPGNLLLENLESILGFSETQSQFDQELRK